MKVYKQRGEAAVQEVKWWDKQSGSVEASPKEDAWPEEHGNRKLGGSESEPEEKNKK